MKHKNPITMDAVFEVGMDRAVIPFLPPPDGPQLNLGAGAKSIEDTIALDASTGWRAPILPFRSRSIAAIHAYHFLEHLAKDELLELLMECQRVLKTNGIMNIVVPHWSAECAYQDLDHKSFWSESTFTNLMSNPYYDGTMPREWTIRARSVMLMGVVQRNLVVVAQLVQEATS